MQKHLGPAAERIILKPILEYNSKICSDKLIVRKILSNDEFIVYAEELRAHLYLRKCDLEEDYTAWLQLPMHTNVVTLFETIDDPEKEARFIATEF